MTTPLADFPGNRLRRALRVSTSALANTADRIPQLRGCCGFATRIIYYIDRPGPVVRDQGPPGVFHDPMYIIVNLAMGLEETLKAVGFRRWRIAQTWFEFEIDRISAYSKSTPN